MNEQVGLGFTYNVTAFSPDGKETKCFNVHNLVPNEGLQAFLESFFFLNSYLGNSGNSFFIALLTNYYEPTVSDTYSIMWNINVPYALFPQDKYPEYVQEIRINWDLGSDLISVTSQNPGLFYGLTLEKIEPTFTFSAPKLITGVALRMGYSNKDGYNSNAIISAALFPSPIQMEKNGKLTIKAGFTLISA